MAATPEGTLYAIVILEINKKAHIKDRKIVSYELKSLIINVENTGVEPVTSCMPCKRSSQLS